MNNEVLNFQRPCALGWLCSKIKEFEEINLLNLNIDDMIRKATNLNVGKLYEFGTLPKKRFDQGRKQLNTSKLLLRRLLSFRSIFLCSEALLQESPT